MTKSEAQDVANSFVQTLRDRVDIFLRNQARAGIVGGQFVYTANDSGPRAIAVKTELEAGGWTVVVDAPNKTVTIS
jgi:hypothetical protein